MTIMNHRMSVFEIGNYKLVNAAFVSYIEYLCSKFLHDSRIYCMYIRVICNMRLHPVFCNLLGTGTLDGAPASSSSSSSEYSVVH